jgi:hypothetical protein
MKIRSGFIAIVAATLVTVAPAPVAMAQALESPPDVNIPEYSDTELKSFAVAVLEVQRINVVYRERLEAAANREEQEEVVKSATDEMTQVVEKNGLSVDRFAKILSHAQMSPELANRVRQHMQEAK